MDVSVIMINYNTYNLTVNAVNSILKYTADIRYEIILIDNASPDGSGEKLKEYFKDKIIYVQSGGNLGTSKAFNLGLTKAKGKYILWLNTDVLVQDNFIKTLYGYMEKNADCGICGGNLRNANNEPIHSFAELPSLKTVKRNMGICCLIRNKLFKSGIKKQYNFSSAPINVGYITGADMMIRSAVIDEIGGFDEDIFMYGEESEFTFRMKRLTKYKAVSVPDAIMQHLEGGSFGKAIQFNEWKFKTKLNGDCVYFKKCYGQDAVFNYLKILKRGYFKLARFNKLLRKNRKSEMHKKALAIVEAKIMETNQ